RDRAAIATMRALGFRASDIAKQYFARSALVAAAGVLLGSLLANSLGEALAGAVISSFGAAAFEFSADPFAAHLVIPLAIGGAALAATAAGAAGSGRVKIAECTRE
ncbi:MAG: ABC transporter permease, partial [Spirochaetaceae bacterium]|nr:ABC transporter permease [Spirochaetaceae bacterium]